MTTAEARNRLLHLFPTDHQKKVSAIVDTLIHCAKSDGKSTGYHEAATMLEVLLLGSDDFTVDDIEQLVTQLRNM